jgi:hypothetical protein
LAFRLSSRLTDGAQRIKRDDVSGDLSLGDLPTCYKDDALRGIMKNESLRRYWLTRWMLGVETLLLFALADGLVIACGTGIINGGEALAFLAGYLLICVGTMATAYAYCSQVSLPFDTHEN